ncbi:hypothetical protein [Campylobacter geochelonis]|uniref:hypothetical protein n=1 Tax=Campylobacter geochelonis TaxID=1780362 RepID=UPI0013F4D603|nr:hypothetical protein [Campylobacter geochelonis]
MAGDRGDGFIFSVFISLSNSIIVDKFNPRQLDNLSMSSLFRHLFIVVFEATTGLFLLSVLSSFLRLFFTINVDFMGVST